VRRKVKNERKGIARNEIGEGEIKIKNNNF